MLQVTYNGAYYERPQQLPPFGRDTALTLFDFGLSIPPQRRRGVRGNFI